MAMLPMDAPSATILVVDDDEYLRAFFTCVLRHAGYAVIAASNGAAALEILATTSVDLVLTDHQMPGLRGDQVIEAIRAQALPVHTILTSEHPQVADVATACQADGYFRKGEALRGLLEQVAEVLERGR
jgi:CheY-like chemotaxis protein